MSEATGISAQAAADIGAWLDGHPETVSVQDVRGVPAHRGAGVDFVWRTQQATYTLQVIGDRWDDTGSFYFETHGDGQLGNAGSFFYTEAQYTFYYFVASRMLYILPMPETRQWLKPRLETFPERRMTAPAAGGEHCIMAGHFVPILAVLAAVPNIEEVQLD